MALFSGKEANDIRELWLGFQILDHFFLLTKLRFTFFPGNQLEQTDQEAANWKSLRCSKRVEGSNRMYNQLSWQLYPQTQALENWPGLPD